MAARSANAGPAAAGGVSAVQYPRRGPQGPPPPGTRLVTGSLRGTATFVAGDRRGRPEGLSRPAGSTAGSDLAFALHHAGEPGQGGPRTVTFSGRIRDVRDLPTHCRVPATESRLGCPEGRRRRASGCCRLASK